MNIKNIARYKLTTNLDKIGRTVCAIHAAGARRDRRGGVLVMLALLCGLLATTAPLQAAMTFDFESGTLQGWTSVMDDGPTKIFAVTSDTTGDRGVAQGGSYRVLPENFSNRDTMTPTLLLRSAKFTLDGSGDISAYLAGGDAGTAPDFSTDLPATAIANGGFQGIALRRVSDNAYVFSDGKASSGAAWTQATINQASLDTLSAGFGTEVYTLDFVDSGRGGNGWVAMDTVSIPGTIVPDWNNYGVSNVTATTADAYATLISTNVTSAYLYWDTTDKGENFTWAHTNILNALSTGLVESTISGLAPETTYYARFYGTNNTAEVNGWSDVISFNTALSSAAYDYGMPITFTNFAGRGTLTNFPALVKFNTNDNFYAGFTSDDAHDLRFTESDGTTVLNYEIEKWDTSGESFVWVQVPELVNNCAIWAYWGKAAAGQPAYATNGATWSEGFSAVLHLNDSVTDGATLVADAHTDSTGNEYHGNQDGNSRLDSGQIAGAADNDTSDNINIPDWTDTGNIYTISCWMYPDAVGEWHPVFGGGTADWSSFRFHGANNAVYYIGTDDGDWNSRFQTADGYLPVGAWHYVTFTFGKRKARLYKDGILTHTKDNMDNPADWGGVNIGENKSDCKWDEFRLDNVARSSNWVWACYQNQGANHSSFVEYGDVERRKGTVFIIN
jgi:hypothetical protein